LSWADPEAVGAATLTAVIVKGLVVGMAAGGVYTPALVMVPTVLLPPATVLTCHVTAVLVTLATAAVKVVVLPKRTWLAPVTVTDGCGVLVPLGLPEVLEHPLAKMTGMSRDTRAIRTWKSRESCTTDLHGAGSRRRRKRRRLGDILLDEPLPGG
jgi:hypothetical protein